MALRFYLVPMVECVRNGNPLPNSRCPKYFVASTVQWGAMDYGAEPIFLVLGDVTAQQHTQLSNQSDVTHIVQYDSLDSNIPGGAVTAVQNGLENLNIPGQWVSTAYTWRVVLRVVAGCFQLSQRVHGMNGRSVFREGVDLSRTWGSLPGGIQQDILDAADSFGWDYSTVTPSWTLRQILRHLAEQWGESGFSFGIATI